MPIGYATIENSAINDHFLKMSSDTFSKNNSFNHFLNFSTILETQYD